MKVLLVDDEPAFLEQAKILLEREDERLDIDTINSPKKALDVLEDDEYEAVVSDYKMPEMDGLEFLETLREEENNNIPFIILTGRGKEEVAMDALNLEADHYLVKGDDLRSRSEMWAQAIIQEIKYHRAKEELRMEKERYEELFHGANELILTTDKDGYIKRINEKVLDVSGYSEEELVGESILKIIDSESEEEAIQFWEEISNKKENITKLLKGKTKHDEVLWLRSGGRPIIENGEVVEIQYNAQDITFLCQYTDFKEIYEEFEE